MPKTFRIVLTGGGSGGHIYPLVAVAEAIQEKATAAGINYTLAYLGPKDSYGALFTSQGITVQTILSGKIRRYFSLENILDVPKFFLGLIQAFWKMYVIMPDIIFSKGGTGALPVIIAGWFYNISILIHESDAKPGLTNLASSRFAKKVFLSFSAAETYFKTKKTEVVGTPVRKDLLEGRAVASEPAKEKLGFDTKIPLTLVIGGSQGSSRINEFIVTNLGKILEVTQLLHQTGIANFDETKELAHAALLDSPIKNRYHPVNYFTNDLATALTAADLVVGRPGSGSVFELSAFGKPAILIPLEESANDHQRANAYAFSKSGGAIIIEESNLLPGIFLEQLKSILINNDLRAKMAAASAAFFIPGAAEKIAEEILEMGG